MENDGDTRLDYRNRIYYQYGTNFQDAAGAFSIEAAKRWGRGYVHYFRGWLPQLKTAAIVDVGCGAGTLLYLLQGLQYTNITGVDISPEQVRLARRVSPAVEEADVLDWLSQHPSEFDLITGLDIIEHLDKKEVLQFLDGSFRALKPGGRIILQTPNAESPWGSQHRYNDFTHEVGFNPNLLTRLLHLAGFREIAARETGPIPWGYSLISSFRFLIWQTIRLGLKIWNLAETGTSGSNVFTRVFLISGIKALD